MAQSVPTLRTPPCTSALSLQIICDFGELGEGDLPPSLRLRRVRGGLRRFRSEVSALWKLAAPLQFGRDEGMRLSLLKRVDKISKLLQRLKHMGHRRWIPIPGVIAILL